MSHACDMANNTHRSDQAHDARDCSSKHALSFPSRVRPERNRRKGRSHFDARSVRLVRERECREERQVGEPEGGKRATMSDRSQGTPLAAFFNIPV